MTEMEMFLMKEVQDIKVKMAKVETIVLENTKYNSKEMSQIQDIIKSQQKRDEELRDMLSELKKEIGTVLGRTEKGDVSLSVTADRVDTIDQSTTQNIKKDGEKK